MHNIITFRKDETFVPTIRNNAFKEHKPLLLTELQFPKSISPEASASMHCWCTTVIGCEEFVNYKRPVSHRQDAELTRQPKPKTRKADIVMVGHVVNGLVFNWAVHGRGRSCYGIDYQNNTLGGWTIDELAQISKDYHEGRLSLPILGND
jgi:hypothetical protein